MAVYMFKIISLTPKLLETLTKNAPHPPSLKNYQPINIGEIEGVELSGHIFNPFPPGMNTHYESSNEHSKRWLIQQNLFTETDRGYQKFLMGDFARLAAYCYRQESEENLHLVTDFIAWLFRHDDFRDSKDIMIGRNPDQIKSMNSFLENVLKNGSLAVELEHETIIKEYPLIWALGTSLLDIRTRLLEQSENGDFSHFVKSMSQYFDANFWEAENRKGNTVSSVLVYQHWRKFTSAVIPTYEIGYLLRGISIPSDIREKIAFISMQTHSSNAICFVNDLFSLRKEINDSITENLVIVKKNEDTSTYASAFDKAIALTNKEVQEYQKLQENIKKNPLLKNYISAYELCESWMDGNLRWSMQVKRYK